MSIVKKILPLFLCTAMLCTTAACSFLSASTDGGSTGSTSTSTGTESTGTSTSAGISASAEPDTGGGESAEKPSPTVPVEYSEEVKKEAKRVVTSVAEKALERDGVSLTAAWKEKIDGYMDGYAIPLFEREGVEEIRFYSLVKSIESRGEAAADAVLSLYSDRRLTGEQYRGAVAFYTDISGYLGGDKLAELLYGLTVEQCNYKIADYNSKYERTGYEFYLDYIAEEEETKRALTEEIGRKNFAALVRVAMDLLDKSDGLFSKKEEVTDGAAYSDIETLTFLSLSGYRLRDLSITEKGWEACLRFAGNRLEKILDENTGMGALTAVLLLTGDAAALAGVAGQAVSLLSSGAVNLEEKDVALFREKDFVGLLSVACSRFDEEEWKKLERVLQVNLQAEKYTALLEEHGYKEAYEAYCARMQTATFAQWRAAAGTENFRARTEEYLFGAFPYLAFALFAAAEK